jgi:filamentous hemagglutinin family protein
MHQGTIASLYALTGCFVNTLWLNCAYAQITPDETLGTEKSNIIQNVNVKGALGDLINGGAIRDSNLFHSFREFNIGEGQRVYFRNPEGITNIISRVTGANPSNILGTIGVNGNANFFLINPNGIVFGQNARLDIAGSVIVSTASSLNFADGTQFNAADPQISPLLTVSVPIGLQFGGNPGGISVRGDGEGLRMSRENETRTENALRVQSDRTLALIGGNVTFEGGTLKTEGGRIEVGSIAGAGVVSLSPTQKGFSLDYEGIANFGDIQLFDATAVDASGTNSGEIQLTGRRVILQGGSQIEASSLEAGSPGGGTGRGTGRGGSRSEVPTPAIGSGGKLTVTASELVELSGTTVNNRPSSLSTDNRTSGDIPGELTINTRQLIIRPGGRVSANTSSSGSGGNITVNASDSVELIGTFTSPGGLRSSGLSVQTRSTGNAGKLTINTRNLTIRDGAEVSASTYGTGNGGSIDINASDSVELTSVYVGNNNELASRIIAEAGNNLSEVDLNAESAPVQGQGGNLTIKTGLLTVRDGAKVSVESRSEDPNAKGAGTLNVTANTIFLDNQGQIAASTFLGQGGNLTLQAQDFLLLRRNSQISTTAGTARAGGDGGNINIKTNFIIAVPTENSDITANAFEGSGGQVAIAAQTILGLEPRSRQDLQSLLGTDTPEEIDPTQLLSNDITAISQQNPFLDGQITLNTPDVDLSRGLVELPTDIVDVSGLIKQDLCIAVSQGSEFIITGRGGLPPSPKEILNPDAAWEDWRIVQQQVFSAKTPIKTNHQPQPKDDKIPTTIVEAQGWVKGADGTVILTSEPVEVTPQGAWLSPPNC